MILLVFPLILMAFLKPTFRLVLVSAGYPHANGAEQVVPGEAVANGFYIVGMTSFAFFAEYGWCTWDRLRSSQATSVEIIFGKAAPRLTHVGGAVRRRLRHRCAAARPAGPGPARRAGPARGGVRDLPRAARGHDHRAVPHTPASQRGGVRRARAVRSHRRGARADRRPAPMGSGRGAGDADLLGHAAASAASSSMAVGSGACCCPSLCCSPWAPASSPYRWPASDSGDTKTSYA